MKDAGIAGSQTVFTLRKHKYSPTVYGIEERSVKIQENMERVIENENRFEKHYDRNERAKER